MTMWIDYALITGVASVFIGICFWLSRRIFRADAVKVGSGILSVIGLMAMDPYAFGSVGGDATLGVNYVWQQFTTLAQICLLLLGAYLLRANAWSRAISVLGVELALLVAVNIVLISRDGAALRFFSGYAASPAPLVSVVLSLLLRLGVLATLASGASRLAKRAPTL